jgi:penicillin-binding protein 1A
VWVGNEDRSARFQSINGRATAALPVWAYFMKLCYADENLKVSKGEFERPANLSIRVDCYNAPKGRPQLYRIQMNLNSNTDYALDIVP